MIATDTPSQAAAGRAPELRTDALSTPGLATLVEIADLRRFRQQTSEPSERPGRRLRCRTAFISDIHLGFDSALPEKLAKVLDVLDCERLYLVGDIIDMWQLRRRWRWSESCDRVVTRLLDMARHGVDVVYVPGNHDEAARPYAGVDIGGVEVRPWAVHETADGRRLLVTHGDQYDLVVKHQPMLCMLGNVAYEWLIRLNRLWNQGRRLFGLSYWSLSHFVKLKVKSACTFISCFEETLAQEAERGGYDGVVCGHIHKAEIRAARTSDGGEIEYYNCGDWVESCTLLTEDFDGTITIVDGLALEAELDAEAAAQLDLDLSEVARSA
ncbi:MAG: UDP-2,3-diacylglucosamine diphosphatase [Acidobacteriota bacterium]